MPRWKWNTLSISFFLCIKQLVIAWYIFVLNTFIEEMIIENVKLKRTTFKNLLLLIKSPLLGVLHSNPLTVTIWLLTLPSSWQPFPCMLVWRIWCWIKFEYSLGLFGGRCMNIVRRSYIVNNLWKFKVKLRI